MLNAAKEETQLNKVKPPSLLKGGGLFLKYYASIPIMPPGCIIIIIRSNIMLSPPKAFWSIIIISINIIIKLFCGLGLGICISSTSHIFVFKTIWAMLEKNAKYFNKIGKLVSFWRRLAK